MKENSTLINKAFNSLGLKRPLIGIAFTHSNHGKKLEKMIPRNDRKVPAGCSFWEMSVNKLFYTVAEDHKGCSIGMYTHNLLRKNGSAGGEEDKAQLMKDISLMKKIDYVRMSEVATIPTLKKRYHYTLYGPWSDFQKPAIKNLKITPTVGFVFADAETGLILTEAVSRVDRGFPLALGRPACAVIPKVVNSGKAAVSFGCCGARAYVMSLGRETDLWVFPGKKLTAYAQAISVFTKANQILSAGHKKRKKVFKSGKELALADSLS